MYKVITPPSSLAVSLEEIKYQLNIEADYTVDDAYLNILLSSAQSYVEGYTNRVLVTQTVQIRVHHYKPEGKYNGVFGDRGVYVPSPAASITSITPYTDRQEGDALDKTNFFLDDFTLTTVLAPVGGYTWPECDFYYINLVVGSAPADIPSDIKLAIMILAADAYENRIEQVRDRKNNIDQYLSKYRCTEFVDYASTSNVLQVR